MLQFFLVAILLGIDSVIDIKTREIPNWISVAIALTSLLNFDVRNLWGLIVALIFFIVALATCKIGGGDVKLIVALSVVCGLWGSFALLLFAQIAMLIFYAIKVIIFRLRGRTADKAHGGSVCLPFVPFILLGYLCSKLIF
ncbi:MAG: A24 family peptidase [Firmicutes bacterium]|nr:A24 family peptidase [[Eubacterium] siraeum]MCM1488169.1 A24 family peptidase [Bacillota bacterium]